MAAANGAIGTYQWRAGERKVADRIQHLVPHEFVRIAQAFRIEHAVLGHNQRVLKRRAERITRAPQFCYIAEETVRASARDLTPEYFGLAIKRQALPTDQRMLELDLHFKSKAARMRPKFA